ncbi:hypothetical protein EEJ42_29090 [Streptomyces botrytidirepellens]|uniref:Uncharacterized protein n=1 Tax=Streptomyces botrytidirepellens TaxID=2486417 RepID=A0A3M8VLH8_9ACTN|nr:hypothetical protein EEJ42_29090 [Streptomyces botrytidirepellens]
MQPLILRTGLDAPHDLALQERMPGDFRSVRQSQLHTVTALFEASPYRFQDVLVVQHAAPLPSGSGVPFLRLRSAPEVDPIPGQ